MWRRALLLLVFLLLLGIASGGLGVLRTLGHVLTGPTTLVAGGVGGLRSFFATLGRVEEVRDRTQALEAENAVLRSEQILQTERSLDASLESRELALAESLGGQAIVADIVERAPTRLLEEVSLNRGSDDLVAPGQPVLSHGFLVGIVRAVSGDRAQVRLLTNSTVTIPVVLQRSRAQGLLRGGLQGLLVTDLPADVTVETDEAILTSPLGGLLPPDIPIGLTEGPLSSESEVLQRTRVRSPVQFSTLERVVIVLPAPESP
ncbi:rod shape-determining protein MreC [Candidatus Berkelbacteria bacterium]|nr:rod shape-determining protein MreC [Candidatus Berkelbacteria bacterium]